jgi:hypothetical protein
MQVTAAVITHVQALVNGAVDSPSVWYVRDSGILIDGVITRYQWSDNKLTIGVTDPDYRRGAEWAGEFSPDSIKSQ